jgi:mannose/fructose/N-acetylgalactosamine-specific phosphotransferase system component IIC
MNWLAIALVGGVVGVDATSVAQTMVSRPFIAATLTGLLAGRPEEGAILGAILELFALVILPVGAARYPESGTAAVAATAAYMGSTTVMSPAVMLITVLFALVWERIAGWSVILDRKFNGEYVAQGILSPNYADRDLERRHLSAIAIDFVRAIVMTIGGWLLGTVALRSVAQLWSMNAMIAPAILSIGLSCMVGAALPLFGGLRARKIALLVGIICGSLIVALR